MFDLEDDDYRAGGAPTRETGGFGGGSKKKALDALFSSGDEDTGFVPVKKERETKPK
jgi:hypothetical protein